MYAFWIKFDTTENLPIGADLGIGVTAKSVSQAINIIVSNMFPDRPLPRLASVSQGIEKSDLDQKHVIPNMGDFLIEGIWFPLGY